MSGAGYLKGDGIWNSPLGFIIYECKTSSGVHAQYGPVNRFSQKWIYKLDSEAEAMKAVLYFFVFHYHGQKGGFKNNLVVMREHFCENLLEEMYRDQAVVVPLPGNTAEKERVALPLFHNKIWDCMNANPVFPFTWFLTAYGTHGILPLWALKRVVAERSGLDDKFRITPP
jgi:hypothetical protein